MNIEELDLSNNFRKNVELYKLNGKIKIIKCENCEGSGLTGTTKLQEGGFSWNGDFCEVCKGSGILKVKLEDETMFVCPNCEGSGKVNMYNDCSLCQGTGFVDWITYLRRSQK